MPAVAHDCHLFGVKELRVRRCHIEGLAFLAKAVGYHQKSIIMAISSTLINSDSTGALPLAERIGMSVDNQIHRRLEPVEPRRHRCVVCELPVQ